MTKKINMLCLMRADGRSGVQATSAPLQFTVLNVRRSARRVKLRSGKAARC